MLVLHWSQAWNNLDSKILSRSSKDLDILWTSKEYKELKNYLNKLNYNIFEKQSSRIDKQFLIWKKDKERVVIEFTFIDIEKHFQTDIDLYLKWQESKEEYNLKWLKIKSLDFNSLYGEKLSHIWEKSKEKYKEDFKKIENYVKQNKVILKLDDSFINRKRLETNKYREMKKDLNINDFFDEYNIPRYIKHDKIHIYIWNYFWTGEGTYKSLVEKNWFSIKENTFLNLSKERQFNLILEELFVLTLERKIILKYLKLRFEYWKNFNETIKNLSSNISKYYFYIFVYYVKKLKGITKYIKDYVKLYSQELILESELRLQEFNILETLPSSFYEELESNYNSNKLIKNSD